MFNDSNIDNEVMASVELSEKRSKRGECVDYLIAKEGYPADRIEKFKTLIELANKYRRVNQYV